ncbi:MAG: hypothetical protein PF638_12185 [Candidatus Delongbacteria bacterium]|jgi:hypothetical protein|nr:hypothetical protein [Candidatus Delongbacteria bacterium]
MSRITADGKTIMKQAHQTASVYLASAIKEIDKKFGRNYAKENPSLVASFMKVAASDANSVTTAQVIAEAIEEVAEALKNKN